MNAEDFTTLHIQVVAGVASVTIDHPPINLLDAELMTELGRFLDAVASTLHGIQCGSSSPPMSTDARSLGSPLAAKLNRTALDAGAQTHEDERNLDELLRAGLKA